MLVRPLRFLLVAAVVTYMGNEMLWVRVLPTKSRVVIVIELLVMSGLTSSDFLRSRLRRMLIGKIALRRV